MAKRNHSADGGSQSSPSVYEPKETKQKKFKFVLERSRLYWGDLVKLVKVQYDLKNQRKKTRKQYYDVGPVGQFLDTK